MEQWIADDPSHVEIPRLPGGFYVSCFSGKAHARRHLTEAGVPMTEIDTTFLLSNLDKLGMIAKRGDDGVLRWGFPIASDAVFPVTTVEDIAAVVHKTFLAGKSMIGQTIRMASDAVSFGSMSRTLSEVLSAEVRYEQVPLADFRHAICDPKAYGQVAGNIVTNLFWMLNRHGQKLVANRSIEDTVAIHPGLLNTMMWMKRHQRELAEAAGLVEAAVPA